MRERLRDISMGVLLLAVLVRPVCALAQDETVIEFRTGTGAREVGIVPAGAETEASGPTALTVGDEGTIYVLDQNNGRVLAVDGQRSQAAPKIMELPEGVSAEDLAVVRDRLYLWAEGLVPLRAEGSSDAPGRSFRAVDEPETDNYALSVFSSMGSQPPGPLNEIVEEAGRSLVRPAERPPVQQYVPSRGLGDTIATVAVAGERDVRILLRRRGEENDFLALGASTQDRIGTVELLDVDTTGRAYAMIEMVGPDGEAGLVVARFSPGGTVEHVYDLRLDPGTAFSRRFVAIGPRGDVLFLRTEGARSQVVRLAGRDVASGARIRRAAVAARKPRPVARPKRAAGVAVLERTRQDVVERAIEFETASWRVTRAAYGSDPAPACQDMSRPRRPAYIIGKLGTFVKGIPYCWGCKTSPEEFAEGLESGRLAGNVCTRSAPRRDILGVDCSSFVSEVWGLNAHVTTAAMPQVAKRLPDPWSMMPGDALNKPGSHVMLFMRFTADRRVEVMEASPNACKGRVCRNTYSLGTLLLRGYQPIRFEGLKS